MGHGVFPNGRVVSGSGSDSDMSYSNPDVTNEKSAIDHNEDLERIHTFERVGTHAEYYEKGGLRTEGDGVNHDGSHHKVRTILPPVADK